MRTTSTLIVFTLALSIVSGLRAQALQGLPGRAAQLTVKAAKVVGDVGYRRGPAEWAEVSEGQQLLEADKLHTGPESQVTLAFSDGSVLVVKQMTQIKVGTLLSKQDKLKVELLLKPRLPGRGAPAGHARPAPVPASPGLPAVRGRPDRRKTLDLRARAGPADRLVHRAGSLPNARGILAIPGGPYIVAIEDANFRKLIVIDPASGAVAASYTYPVSSPPTGIPIALAPDLTGGILVAEQYSVGYEGGISNFTGSPTSVDRTEVFNYGNYPPLAQVVCTGVAKDPRTGEIFVAEKESPLMPSGNRIVSIVPGTVPGFGARTVLHDYGTIALGECVLGPGGGIYVAETSGDALGLILSDRTRALEIQLPANSQPRGLLLLP